MKKEFEELKSIVLATFGALGFFNPSKNEEILKDRDKVLNALTELKQIKEAKPIEALQNLYDLRDYLLRDRVNIYNTSYYIIVERALLKTQEMEKENAELKKNIEYQQYSIDKSKEIIKQFIEQEKVLEIIKEKNVDIVAIKFYTFNRNYENKIALKMYNSNVNKEQELTQEEFELLKRWCEK